MRNQNLQQRTMDLKNWSYETLSSDLVHESAPKFKLKNFKVEAIQFNKNAFSPRRIVNTAALKRFTAWGLQLFPQDDQQVHLVRRKMPLELSEEDFDHVLLVRLTSQLKRTRTRWARWCPSLTAIKDNWSQNSERSSQHPPRGITATG